MQRCEKRYSLTTHTNRTLNFQIFLISLYVCYTVPWFLSCVGNICEDSRVTPVLFMMSSYS